MAPADQEKTQVAASAGGAAVAARERPASPKEEEQPAKRRKVVGQSAAFTVATVCLSNNNRSMAAHKELADAGFDVSSFGTGREVRMPGPSEHEPQVFAFGTTYEHMYQTLLKQDEELYTRNGCLPMLNRNRFVKSAPQRFQDNDTEFDMLITFEKRVFDMVVEHLSSRASSFKPVQVINLETKDRAEEAGIGGQQCLEFCTKLAEAEDDWEDELPDLLAGFEKQKGLIVLHSVQFY